jgi:hypothetical protein
MYECTIVSTWTAPDGTPARLETNGTLFTLTDNPGEARTQAVEWARANLGCPATATHKAFL